MILVFIFLVILIILSIFSLILTLSSIKIKIIDLNIINFETDKKYTIVIQLYLLNKIKLLTIKIDNNKLKELLNNTKIKKVNLENIKNKLPSSKEIIKSITKLNISIEQLDLQIKTGLIDAPTTAYLTTLITGIISIIITRLTSDTKDIKHRIKYSVKPMYNKDTININVESIISIKIVHIIYMLYILVKKGRDKNGRTSNRRSYVSSYEFN